MKTRTSRTLAMLGLLLVGITDRRRARGGAVAGSIHLDLFPPRLLEAFDFQVVEAVDNGGRTRNVVVRTGIVFGRHGGIAVLAAMAQCGRNQGRLLGRMTLGEAGRRRSARD